MGQGALWAAVLAFLVVGILCLSRGAPRIEADLGSRASAALAAEGLPTDGLTFSGRDAVLAASLGATGTFERARDIVAAVPGVRAVNRAGGAEAAAVAPSPEPAPAPAPAGERLAEDIRAAMEGRTIGFQSGSAEITPSGLQLVDEIARLLREAPDVGLVIEGHTDSSGNAEQNQRLSERRAAAVRTRLIEAGIAATRLTAVGLGSDRPIADNATSEGRLANRRIEFHVREEN